jgi:hypothetical protein
MKNIKYLIILFLQVSLLQLSIGQELQLDNGRDIKTQPTPPAAKEVAKKVDDFSKGYDTDLPGQNRYDHVLTNVDEGVKVLNDRDEAAQNFISAEDIMAKIEALESELQSLRKVNDQLELENRTIRKGMSNCCTDASFDLALEQSFLLQNAPNPFTTSTKIQYFMPDDVQGASIDVRNLTGTLLASYPIGKGGIGDITIGGESFTSGTYIYTLTVEGKLIDSKVMILTE